MALRVVNMKGFVLLIVVTVISFQWKMCSSLHVVIDPEAPTEVIDRLVDISCVLDKNDTTEIVLIEISKDDQPPMVTVRENSQHTFGPGISRRFEAKGFITQGSDQSHLTLTIHSPQQEDGGQYKCAMYFVDVSGILREKHITRTLLVDKLSVTKTNDKIQDMEATISTLLDKISQLNDTDHKYSSIVDKLVDRVISLEKAAVKSLGKESSLESRISHLEKEGNKMSTEIDNLKHVNKNLSTELNRVEGENKKMSARIDSLEHDKNNLSAKIVSLETDSRAASAQIQGLIDEVKTTSAFRAVPTNPITLVKGETLVFDTVLLHHGLSGYDQNTGVYTAPRNGLYFFYLFLTIRKGGGEAFIKVNNTIVGPALYAYSPLTSPQWTQSTINTVVLLKAGDKVSAVLVYQYESTPIIDNNQFSSFGGYLIRPF